jgi:YD repeat-containing protein
MKKPSLFFIVILAAHSAGCAMLDSEAVYDETSSSCVVEQHDMETGRLVARLEFVPAGLVTHRVNYGEHRHTLRRHTYDRAGKLIRARLTWEVAAGLPEDGFSWQRSYLPVWKVDVVRVVEANFEYGSHGKVVRATTEITTTTAESVDYSLIVHNYVYDENGRKIAKESEYDASNGLVRSKRVDYAYDDEGRLQSRKSTSFETASEPRSSWTATFGYDARGNLVEINTSGNPMALKREYDEDNRLITLGYGKVFTWDDSGRLLRNGRSNFATDYTYDDQGRLHTTRFDRGGGYDTTYSEGCPSGFADPAFTPNVDGHLFYEGRNPTLGFW